MNRAAWTSVVLVASAVLSGTARAHGGRPQTYDVLVDASEPNVLVVPATFGVLVSEDAGETFSLVCTNAMPDPRPGAHHPMALTDAGTLLVAQELGLVRGPRHGCALAYVTDPVLSGAFVADVVPWFDDTQLVLRSDAATENALFVARTDATSVTPLPARFPLGFLPDRVRVAPSDARRLWVSGTATRAGTTFLDGRIYLSDDAGASYAEHAMPLELDERRLHVLAVDPTDPDRAVGVILALGQDRPIVLRREGASLRVTRLRALEADTRSIDRAFAVAFAPDGRAWIGNDLGGLHALDGADTLTALDPALGVGCLVVQGDTLFLCADGYPDALGDGYTLARQPIDVPLGPTPLLRFEDVLGPRACGDASDPVCESQWPETLVDLGRAAAVLDAGTGIDAGTSVAEDAAARADAGQPPDGAPMSVPAAAACACRAHGRRPTCLPALLGVGLAFLCRRRTSRRRA